jgi:hypothetical protein
MVKGRRGEWDCSLGTGALRQRVRTASKTSKHDCRASYKAFSSAAKPRGVPAPSVLRSTSDRLTRPHESASV